jgi:ribosomal protein S2
LRNQFFKDKIKTDMSIGQSSPFQKYGAVTSRYFTNLKSIKRWFSKSGPMTLSHNAQSQKVRDRLARYLIKKAGHVGHTAKATLQPRLRHPISLRFLLGKRGRGDVGCPYLSADQAAQGLYVIGKVIQRGGGVLLIDTRGEASAFCRLMEAEKNFLPLSISFAGQHWVGGTLTNWDTISKMVGRCGQISNRFDNFLVKNRVHLSRYEKMRRSYLGLTQTSKTETGALTASNDVLHDLLPVQKKFKTAPCVVSVDTNYNQSKLRKGLVENSRSHNSSNSKGGIKLIQSPDLLVVINPAENKHIIKEAERLGIPVVGLVDSDDTLHGITVPLSINTNSLLCPDSFAILAVKLAITINYRSKI